MTAVALGRTEKHHGICAAGLQLYQDLLDLLLSCPAAVLANYQYSNYVQIGIYDSYSYNKN